MASLAVRIVGVPASVADSLRRALAREPGVEPADASADRLLEEACGSAPPDAVVVGEEAGNQIALAQAVQQAEPEIAVVILCAPDRADEVSRAIRFAAMISPHTHCRSHDELNALAAELVEFASSARRRRTHREVAKSAESQTIARLERLTGSDALGRLLEAAPVAVLTLDAQMRITSHNRQAPELLGRRELADEDFRLLFSEDVRSRVSDFLETPIRSAPAQPEQEVFRLVGEPERCVELTPGRFVAPTGEPGTLVMAADVTARVIAERERAAAEEAHAFLARTSALLDVALDPVETLQRMAELAVPDRGDLCLIDLLEGEDIHGVAFASTDPEMAEAVREVRAWFPISPEGQHPVARALRTGEAVILEEMDEETYRAIAESDEHLALMRKLHYHSALVVPLRARGRTHGAISLLYVDPNRRYANRDLELLSDVARRASLALDNARLYEQEHEAASVLQRSLLPAELPSIDGLRLDARYQPAELRSGGDWYDALPLPDGRALCIVGDVVGSGIEAAAVMGQLRSAARAYGIEHHSPRRVVQALDGLIERLGIGEMTTVVCMLVDVTEPAVVYSCAGHPPPLHLPVSGEARFLTEARSSLLGVSAEHTEAVAPLAPGSQLLAYTDGLVERRGESIDASLERLRHAAARANDHSSLIDTVLRELRGDQQDDDVALLAIELVGG